VKLSSSGREGGDAADDGGADGAGAGAAGCGRGYDWAASVGLAPESDVPHGPEGQGTVSPRLGGGS
jgi:hypothetical protein